MQRLQWGSYILSIYTSFEERGAPDPFIPQITTRYEQSAGIGPATSGTWEEGMLGTHIRESNSLNVFMKDKSQFFELERQVSVLVVWYIWNFCKSF